MAERARNRCRETAPCQRGALARPALRLRHRMLLRAHRRRLRAGAHRPLSRGVGAPRDCATSCTSPSAAASGPCALANVVLLLFDGQALWFHSVNSEALVLALYDHIEAMLEAGASLAAPPALAALQFTASTWQPRPDGQPVRRPPPAPRAGFARTTARRAATVIEAPASRREARLHRPPRRPRRHPARCRAATAELVFDAPWQGRVFGMAVALSEQGLLPWEEFRQALIREIAAAEGHGGEFRYYDAWLAAFEEHPGRSWPPTPGGGRGDRVPVRVRRARRRLADGRRGALTIPGAGT